MATKTDTDTLRRKERVVAAVDMPGIPAGTPGKVTFVEGLTWIRYWVRFDNGVVRGSINRSKLARPGEELGAARDEAAVVETNGDAAAAADAGAGGAADDGVMHGGVLVPAHLLDRSRARREALGK